MQRVFGFDIDGVLTDDDDGTKNLWLEEAAGYFGIPLVKRTFLLHEALGIHKEDIGQFLALRGEHIMRTVPLRPYCLEVLTWLRDVGVSVHLITARHNRFRNLTEEWLARYRIPYDTLTMKPDHGELNKGVICRRLGVEFFIDDRYENCVQVRNAGVHTLMFYASHNKEQAPPVPIVRDWMEIDSCAADFLMATEQEKV